MSADSSLHPTRQLVYIALAVLITIPGSLMALSDAHPAPAVGAMAFGLAIVGAAFMLSWAAEVIQMDIAAGLALALLALIAVLPEYAVDFVFTWKAGTDPDNFAHLALANMTGANQLLIGLGWPMVVLIATWRRRRVTDSPNADQLLTIDQVGLERHQSVEIAYLTLASVFGLTLPLRDDLNLLDAAVLVGLYALYLRRLSKAPAEAPHLIGPAAVIGTLEKRSRRTVNIGLFVVAAAVILLCAEPFAESLVESGRSAGIDEFLLVKWLAPLASEAPEFLVAGLFAWRLASGTGLGALLSSKVNQWTLLVGTLPIVFAISASTAAGVGFGGLPIDSVQRVELYVTAAQSVFAVALLASRSMDRREAYVMLGLFSVSFATSWLLPHDLEVVSRMVVGTIYLLLAAGVLLRDRRSMRGILRDGLRVPYEELV